MLDRESSPHHGPKGGKRLSHTAPFSFRSGLLLMVSACSASGAQSVRPLERFSGCYALTWNSWRIGESLADSSWQAEGLENAIWLTTTRVAKSDGGGSTYVVRAAPGEVAGIFGDVQWTWDQAQRALVVEWNATTSGIRLLLIPRDSGSQQPDSLSGFARWWSSDADVPDKLRAEVQALRRACADLR